MTSAWSRLLLESASWRRKASKLHGQAKREALEKAAELARLARGERLMRQAETERPT